MVQAIAVTTLLYGSVIFGCIRPARLQLTGGARVFVRAEIFLRKMLRWALKSTPIDTRVSMLYLASNSVNVQLLCQKSCIRFFNSIQEHPRFVTDFV